MMILSIIYMAAIIVIGVTVIAGIALFKIDKNAGESDESK
jgi:hypothetical protein